MRSGLATAMIFTAALVGAPAAMANTARSTNWAGYAVHRAGVSFHQVSATWTQPDATCLPGEPSYSADWVGLGGYKPTSDALEQTGTEVDCTGAGKVESSAWYELVPAPSKTISLVVEPGDVMHATVSVAGHRVTIELGDLTRHHGFHKTFTAPSIDVSSAEWIVEAPSECLSQFACQALPLANFGSVAFNSATATSTTGGGGPIANHRWGRTRIDLISGNQSMIVARNADVGNGSAAPSPLFGGGGAFDVTYAPTSTQVTQARTRRLARASAAGYIEH
ncbi:MAG TPA: G1 family glutamic endopeptidase [Solirubrobacteraceae bacterium]